MPITIYIEIAIGIVFVWLFLALAVMAIQEWVAAISRKRAKDMQDILRGMLEDPSALLGTIDNDSIVKQLYRHPAIQSLCKPIKGKRRIERLNKRKQDGKAIQNAFDVEGKDSQSGWWGLPSYIPNKTFALALYDVITTAGTEQSVIQNTLEDWTELVNKTIKSLRDKGTLPKDDEAFKAIEDDLNGALAQLKEVAKSQLSQNELTAQLNAKVAALTADKPKAFKEALSALAPTINELPRYVFSPVVAQGITRLVEKNSAAKRVLANLQRNTTNLAAQGENAIAAFRADIEAWFDNTMVRAGGWYKRRSMWLSFVFGCLVALVLNIDSLAVVTTLYREPTVRSTLVAQAEALERVPEVSPDPSASQIREGLTELDSRLQSLGLPVGWKKLESEQCIEIENDSTKAAIKIGDWCVLPGELNDGIPAETPDGSAAGMADINWIAFGGKKVAGWLLSGAMAAQGAPFWFDILKRLVNVRAGGPKPEEIEEKKGSKKNGRKNDSESDGNR